MKKAICGLIVTGVIGLSAFAQEAQSEAEQSEASPAKQSIAEGEKKLPIPNDTATAKETPATPAKKETSIIGKRVYDMNGTELGRVQDLVVDMEKGELGYVVIEVPTDDGPRKLPVPPRALKPGEQEGTLVLNISQAVLAAAEVYRDDELPEPGAFSVDTAVGSAAGSETGTASSDDKESQPPQEQKQHEEQPEK